MNKYIKISFMLLGMSLCSDFATVQAERETLANRDSLDGIPTNLRPHIPRSVFFRLRQTSKSEKQVLSTNFAKDRYDLSTARLLAIIGLDMFYAPTVVSVLINLIQLGNVIAFGFNIYYYYNPSTIPNIYGAEALGTVKSILGNIVLYALFTLIEVGRMSSVIESYNEQVLTNQLNMFLR